MPEPSNVTSIIKRGLAYEPGTREVIGEVELREAKPRRRRKKAERRVFGLVDVNSMARLELTGFQWVVLHHVMRATNLETNQSRIHVGEIASATGVAASSVSRAMIELRERQIIFTDSLGVHRVNKHIFYRGSVDDWDNESDLEVEPIWERE